MTFPAWLCGATFERAERARASGEITAAQWDGYRAGIGIGRPGCRAEAEARARWDRRYGICEACEASGVSVSALKLMRIGPKLKHGTVYQRACPDCRNAAQIRDLVGEAGYVSKVGGDPRGWVVRLFPKGTPEAEIENGRAQGIGVPA